MNKERDLVNNMDHQNIIKEEEEAVKIKLTKYGCFLDLLAFSSFLSSLGIVTSLPIIIGGIATVVMIKPQDFSLLFFMLCIILNIIYLVMWTLLKMKTHNQSINGIEKITTVYCYVTGCLEVKGMIIMILFGLMSLVSSSYFNLLAFGMIIIATFGLMFAFMKVHGIMLKRSKWIGIYLGSRYAFLIIFLVSFIFTTISHRYYLDDSILIGPMVLLYLIIDVGLTIILHRIIADKENG